MVRTAASRVDVRRAGPDDAAVVLAMVRELADDILGLDDLFVRPGYRDAGAGRLLVTELARLAAPEGPLIRREMREDNLRTEVIAAWPPESFPARDA